MKTKKHLMVVLKMWSATDVLPWIANGVPRKVFGTVDFSVSTSRLRLFKSSLKCARCGVEGRVFLLERFKEQLSGWHLNLYAKGKNGKLILMTKDHIIPIALGGASTMKNYQTMCQPCNCEKGHTIEVRA